MNKLTRFEVTRLLSARALQLSLGAPPLIKAAKEENYREIARKELEKKVLPISVLRTLPNNEIQRIEIGG